MKANKDPQIEIKDCDKDSYHVELTRITGTAQNPNTVKDIQIFTKKDFDGFQRATNQYGIGITGYTSARVVHNPTLENLTSQLRRSGRLIKKPVGERKRSG